MSRPGHREAAPSGGNSRWSFDITPTIAPTFEVDTRAIAAIDYAHPEWIFWDVGLTLVHPSPRVITEQLSSYRRDGTPPAANHLLSSLVAAAEARHSRWPGARSGDEQVSLAWAVMLGLPVPETAALMMACLARTDLYCDVDESAHAVLAGLRSPAMAKRVVRDVWFSPRSPVRNS